MPDPLKNTLFLFRGTMQSRILAKTDEAGPFDFLYGYDRFRPPKAHVIALRGVRDSLESKLRYLVERPFSLATRLGWPLEIYSLFPREIAKASTIFCINDAISLAMLWHKALGRFDARLVVLMQSLSERQLHFRLRPAMVTFLARLLRAADTVLTLSRAALSPLRDVFGVPEDKLGVFRFGVDPDYWTPNPARSREDFFLAVGNDLNRDYDTLCRALPPGARLKLVTSRRVRRLPPGVEQLSGIPDAELRRLYRAARCVVVPSIRLRHESSGLSCLLQALACGAPPLISPAPAPEEYLGPEAGAAFYEPGNVDDLRRHLASPPPGPAGGRYLPHSTAAMARQLEALVAGSPLSAS